MIEADFRREYHLSLPLEFPNMSWREFCVLLNNLSPDSIYRQIEQLRKQGKIAVDLDDKRADRLMNKFLG